jgi:hypothetical protein
MNDSDFQIGALAFLEGMHGLNMRREYKQAKEEKDNFYIINFNDIKINLQRSV